MFLMGFLIFFVAVVNDVLYNHLTGDTRCGETGFRIWIDKNLRQQGMGKILFAQIEEIAIFKKMRWYLP